MLKLGRNDPCHCGSGKKYKKCHLDADQRNRPAPPPPPASELPASASVKNLPELLDKLSKAGTAADQKDFAELAAEIKPLIEFTQRKDEIEAAAAELAPHRGAFDKLAADPARYGAFAETLFAEECFAPLRFTAADVRRAFDQVGQPAMLSPDDRTVEILRAAILHIADKHRRTLLAMGLNLLLPEFVAAGRFLEAWLVQSVAYETSEFPGESNVFLHQMFAHGYDALAAAKRAKDEGLLSDMGIDLDRLRGMSADEIDSWLATLAADPAKARAIEAFFAKNPGLRKESVANLEAMERNSAKLFEREDSLALLLADEELQPWLARFNERFSQSEFATATPSPDPERTRKLFDSWLIPLMREMAAAIFNPDRLQQLVTALKKYRSERFAARDKDATTLATGAINYLEREDSPGENTFLVALCWRSLHSVMQAMPAETAV